MDNPPRLSYSILRKKERILNLKNEVSRLSNSILICFLFFIIAFLPVLKNIKRYSISISMSGQLFPYLRTSDIAWAILPIAVGTYLYFSYRKYQQTKSKYESLRQDIIKDLDSNLTASRLCFCHGECECKDKFIKEMEQLGVDLIFK